MIVAATGHRPPKLGGYGENVAARLRALALAYFRINTDIERVISGMALGWDMAVAEAALEIGLPVVAAVPFVGQDARWPLESRQRYQSVLTKTEVVVVSPGGYAAWKLQKRNEWMVDNANKMVILWDGSSGGTNNCVQYANRRGVPTENLWSLYTGR